MKRHLPWLLVFPAVAVITVVLLTPLAQTVGMTVDGRGNPFAIYTAFLGSGFNRGVLWRTLEIAVLVTAISIAIGLPTAYVIAGSPKARRSLLIIAAVFPLLTGTVVRSFAWIVILGRNGLVNQALLAVGLVGEPLSLLYTETAIVIGLVYLFCPLMILSLVGVLENIDGDLTQAAASLGASPSSTFFRIILPLAVPGLIVGSVLVFTGSFTAYTTPQLLGGTRETVLATLLYQKAMISFDWAAASAIAVIMVVLTIAVVLAMNQIAHRLNPATG